jgi:helicase SWR1
MTQTASDAQENQNIYGTNSPNTNNLRRQLICLFLDISLDDDGKPRTNGHGSEDGADGEPPSKKRRVSENPMLPQRGLPPLHKMESESPEERIIYPLSCSRLQTKGRHEAPSRNLTRPKAKTGTRTAFHLSMRERYKMRQSTALRSPSLLEQPPPSNLRKPQSNLSPPSGLIESQCLVSRLLPQCGLTRSL